MNTKRVSGFGASRRNVLLHATASLLTCAAPGWASSDPAGTTVNWPSLRLLDGSLLKPNAWQGVPVVVVFWATWCPYCKRHNANIEKLHQASTGKNFRVLGVSTETDRVKVVRYMESNQFHFPVTMTDSSFRMQFSDRRVIPLTCLVSATGHLVQAIPGEWAQDDVMALATAAWG